MTETTGYWTIQRYPNTYIYIQVHKDNTEVPKHLYIFKAIRTSTNNSHEYALILTAT